MQVARVPAGTAGRLLLGVTGEGDTLDRGRDHLCLPINSLLGAQTEHAVHKSSSATPAEDHNGTRNALAVRTRKITN